ncbi:hypothetical protein EJ06DRAFT_424616 [Trichodelitschia bisporula]|uniref:Stc1 domain-containing protein n=1 Tax=Trichodelitschia bisporula TaxID=703511 RepID=A0A6G1HW95_9PEZI|nr:hypothetical protein EJ06DRAFT_424616 [Trichodelitschia bisporula]
MARGPQLPNPNITAATLGNVTLPTKLKCSRCSKFKGHSNYSNKQILGAKFAVKVRRVSTPTVKCRTCTELQPTELYCGFCDNTAALDNFSKAHRSNPDQAKCARCIAKQLDFGPDDEVALREVRRQMALMGGSMGGCPDDDDDDDDTTINYSFVDDDEEEVSAKRIKDAEIIRNALAALDKDAEADSKTMTTSAPNVQFNTRVPYTTNQAATPRAATPDSGGFHPLPALKEGPNTRVRLSASTPFPLATQVGVADPKAAPGPSVDRDSKATAAPRDMAWATAANSIDSGLPIYPKSKPYDDAFSSLSLKDNTRHPNLTPKPASVRYGSKGFAKVKAYA